MWDRNPGRSVQAALNFDTQLWRRCGVMNVEFLVAEDGEHARDS